VEEAAAQGRDPEEARRAFGPMLLQRERSRDIRAVAWVEALKADVVFGWRQLRKRPVTSAAAVLSLALGIGACTSAFRLIDALLLRTMPVAHADRLYAMGLAGTGPDGTFRVSDSNEYPQFQMMRAAVKQEADMMAVSWVDRVDVMYRSGSSGEMEKAHRQFVSGNLFSVFGMKPVLGRLLTEADNDKPKAHAYAVLSYDYWSRRFGQDPRVVGRTFAMGTDIYEIVGVGPKGFTGTETGTFTDLFLPTMMYEGVTHEDWS
jgi:hypothetical protein